jgi:hypothetical protein
MTQISLDRLFDDAKARVQVAPNDFLARSLLWQVFACRGEFDRARKQLDVMLGLDSSWAIEVQACHGLIDSELQRAEVFAGMRSPTCFGPPPAWFGALVAAVGHVAQGQVAAASTLLDEVAEAVPEVPGSINGQTFTWICDGDARVMRPDGTKFANLFASGGAARGVSGPSYWGYLPAMGLGSAVTLARLEQSSENMSRTFGCKSLIVLEWVLGGEKV